MRLKWATVIVAVCVVVTVAAVAYAAGKAAAEVPEVIRAQKFEVVDAEGKVRATLGVSADMMPSLRLCDERSQTRASLSLLGGSSGLSLYDQNSHLRALLIVSSSNTPELVFFDDKANVRAELSAGPRGPSLALGEGNGAGPTRLSLLCGRMPSVTLFDEEGNMRAMLGATEMQTVATAAAGKRAESSLVLFDVDGEVIWSAP